MTRFQPLWSRAELAVVERRGEHPGRRRRVEDPRADRAATVNTWVPGLNLTRRAAAHGRLLPSSVQTNVEPGVVDAS